MERPLTGGDWVVALGKKHGARARAADQAASVESDRSAQATKLSLERWTHIVAAMTDLVAEYNVGFDRTVLSVAQDRSDPNRPTVTIEAGGDGAPSLTAALEGELICVHGRDAEALSYRTEHALSAVRDDAQTAAYVLQRWMERL